MWPLPFAIGCFFIVFLVTVSICEWRNNRGHDTQFTMFILALSLVPFGLSTFIYYMENLAEIQTSDYEALSSLGEERPELKPAILAAYADGCITSREYSTIVEDNKKREDEERKFKAMHKLVETEK